MLIFGRDCGCDDRAAYMQENPVGFLLLAGVVLLFLLIAVRGLRGEPGSTP